MFAARAAAVLLYALVTALGAALGLPFVLMLISPFV